jgi:beta-lactamase regulating signal transducer with metallopeptidase domain
LIARLVERPGVSRRVRWILSLHVEVPTVVGWFRPTVLIPAQGLARLTMRQIEAILAHELDHIRRHDYLVNVLQVCIETALFFHPTVWWISRRIRVERDSCCDDWAVALCGGDRLLVARALFSLEEDRATPVVCVAATGASLNDRVKRLMSRGLSARCSGAVGWASASLLVLAGCLLVAMSIAGPSKA